MQKFSLYLIFVFLLAIACFSMTGGCGSGGNNKGTNTGNGSGGVGSVRGVVYDAAAKDIEVENATVTIGGQSGLTRTADNANGSPVGSYLLASIPTGTDTAEVQLSGQTAKQRFAFTPPVIKNGVNLVNLYINIGQIRGIILRPDGKPAAGAFVTFISNLRSEPTQTDADGKFLFPIVPKGEVRLESQFGPASDVRTVTVGNGLLDVGTIKLVEQSSPNPPGLPYSIKGKVTANSLPITNLSVALIRNNIQQEAAQTGSDGTYQFAVPAGTYTLRITSGTFQDAEKTITLVSTNQPITADFALLPR
jgi:Carboxypeptidase regulatory-like domain